MNVAIVVNTALIARASWPRDVERVVIVSSRRMYINE